MNMKNLTIYLYPSHATIEGVIFLTLVDEKQEIHKAHAVLDRRGKSGTIYARDQKVQRAAVPFLNLIMDKLYETGALGLEELVRPEKTTEKEE